MSEREPLTRADLDEASCAHCGEDHGHMEIGQKCHPGLGQTVSYHQGMIYVACRFCQELVAKIAVAESEEPEPDEGEEVAA